MNITRSFEKKRANRNLASKEKRRIKRFDEIESFKIKKRNNLERLIKEENSLKLLLGGKITYLGVLDEWLPTNLKYLLNSEHSIFYKFKLPNYGEPSGFLKREHKILYVPEIFSLIENADESFAFLTVIIDELLFGTVDDISFSYENTKHLDVGAQVVLDIVIGDILKFLRNCNNINILRRKWKFLRKDIGLIGAYNTSEDIRKILFSVGSLALHAKAKILFPDIEPYPLCSHSRENEFNPIKAIEQKELDLTHLADYVINSLARVKRRLTDEKLDDLCKIMGEVLINAEEHSTTKNRFSIGYFHEKTENGKHFGMFRLVILNFGQTIYEKFSDPNCPNQTATEKMKQLSQKYTKSGFFTSKQFEEECLWTLYALQEGITSIPDKKRGNGSIQFIDSFFSLKGNDDDQIKKSKMTILSGNTKIVFDGTYRIVESESNGEKFKYMTFNPTGNIEDKPDKEAVQFVHNYFPGVMISARIYFDREDLLNDTN